MKADGCSYAHQAQARSAQRGTENRNPFLKGSRPPSNAIPQIVGPNGIEEGKEGEETDNITVQNQKVKKQKIKATSSITVETKKVLV